MNRFQRLEIEQRVRTAEPGVQRQEPRQEPDHDQHHWLKLADEERRHGRHESALRLYSRALELDKSLLAGWVGQVRMLIALGEYPEAELWSRKALELFKNNAELLSGRTQALCRTGDLKSAQATNDSAINQPGLCSYPWFARAELMLARRENLDEYCFGKAVQLDSDWLIPLEAGAVYVHYNRPAKALAWTQRAAATAPDQAYCWRCQGECELAMGLTGAAERSFKRCLEYSPKDEAARDALRQLANNRRPVGQFFRRLFRS